MFLENKYLVWYKKLTEKANRKLIGYTENHHIIPRSLGGNDSPENLVKLTAKEHYIAHLILTKITLGESRKKMVNAFFMMANCKDKNQKRVLKVNSSLYQILKEQSIQFKKEYKHTDDAKRKISAGIKGTPKPPKSKETLSKMSLAQKGKTAWNKGLSGATYHSEETKIKMSKAHKGKEKNEETKKN